LIIKNVTDFYKKKLAHEKISMVTCYDYTSACLLNKTKVDCLLVGDSLAMTMHGYESTVFATIDMMCMHTQAVARGAKDKWIVGDLPFLSYRGSLNHSVKAAQKLMQAGAHSLKLEGAEGNLKLIRHLTASGVPMMGHLGLTPQFVHGLGGYRVQGKTKESALQLKNDALSLQEAGCFALVLECVPATLAKEITASLAIPVIGIGAGAGTDGQVLVWQDMLGLNDIQAKFVKKFLPGDTLIIDAVETYIREIHSGDFPHHAHSYGIE
jgi:3-methyl-2-oxobutanoate hydroxymethyltransferase